MKIYFFILILPFFIAQNLLSQESINSEIIRNAQRNVCAIKILNKNNKETMALGCGVVLMTKVKDRNEFFVATVFHILKDLIKSDEITASISLFDRNGNVYEVSKISGKNIIWTNQSMDAALILLPRNLKPEGDIPANYEFPGLANLKLIGEPNWGEDIYLFGYRWINEQTFIDIVKKGILSVGTKDLPGYEGNLVYLIDNMANKGMSGGLAFTSGGVGIGIISSYVYEVGDEFLNSDDLTVCLPLTIYFNALSSIIVNYSDEISKLLDK